MKESEALYRIDRFWLWFAPVWFQWLAAVTMMAAIKWLGDQTGDWLLGAIYGLSIGMSWCYFAALGCRRDGFLVTRMGRGRWTYLLALVLGSGGAGLAWWVSMALVTRLSGLVH